LWRWGLIKTGGKPAFVQEARHPNSSAPSRDEGSGHALRRAPALAERRGKAMDRAPGAADLLKDRLALPVREVAGLLGVSSAAIRLMIAHGELPGRKIGGGTERVTFIVPTAALLSWLEGAPRPAADGSA